MVIGLQICVTGETKMPKFCFVSLQPSVSTGASGYRHGQSYVHAESWARVMEETEHYDEQKGPSYERPLNAVSVIWFHLERADTG